MYEVDSYKKPFWAENSGFLTGRDSLGIQNSSITTYGRLLPGMTNVTLRLRYYGFYMWVLDEFFKIQGDNEEFTLREQHNFVRRAELMIAYIMRHLDDDEQSIIGSNFTAQKTGELDQNGFYDIALGADQFKDTKKNSVYWDYRSGALGQYFAGSLSSLGLLTVADKFFSITSKGKKLAETFRTSLTIDTSKLIDQASLFLKQLNIGHLTLDQIENLSSFKINYIPVGSEEWEFYMDILLEQDGEDLTDASNQISFMRRDTVGLMLNYLSSRQGEYGDRSFILHEYLTNTMALKTGASLGWFYYYVNEAFHFALETLFWSILVKLDGNPMLIGDFIQSMLDEVLQETDRKGIYSGTDKVEDVIISIEAKEMHIALSDLEEEVKSISNRTKAITQAFELMLLIWLHTQEHLPEIKSFEDLYFITGQKGRVSENFENYVNCNLELSYQAFVKKAIIKLMNDHVNTAYRKMGNGESNLLKFIIEDGVISHIQTMTPRHTSPRLVTLTNFLHDLTLVDADHNITDKGKIILNKISA